MDFTGKVAISTGAASGMTNVSCTHEGETYTCVVRVK